MKTQTIINIVFAVAFVGYVVSPSPRNPTFDRITCNSWNVIDEYGRDRITTFNHSDGSMGIHWRDKDEKVRLSAFTDHADGSAGIQWIDTEMTARIAAGTTGGGFASAKLDDRNGKTRIFAYSNSRGKAGVTWLDNNGKLRISAGTTADEIVSLPTKDENP